MTWFLREDVFLVEVLLCLPPPGVAVISDNILNSPVFVVGFFFLIFHVIGKYSFLDSVTLENQVGLVCA